MMVNQSIGGTMLILGRLTLIGDMDPIAVVLKLRKLWDVDIVSFEPRKLQQYFAMPQV